MKIIVIAPHHDDEVIGCGGSICLHSQRGDELVVIYVFSGWSAIPSIGDKNKASRIIQSEAIKSGRILGVRDIRELKFSDRSFAVGQESLYELIKIMRNIGDCDILYIPHKYERDREHRIVNELAREAIWLASSDYLPDLGTKILPPNVILGYEVWSPLSQYQLVVDITPVISCKKNALKAYKTQMQIKNWIDGCIGLNAYRGITTGKGKFVEVFQVQKIDCKIVNGGVP